MWKRSLGWSVIEIFSVDHLWIKNYQRWPVLFEFWFTSLHYTVKQAQANLPAMAANKLFRRWNYSHMQAKISAGTDCLQFPRVIGGNLPAPASNSGEVFIVRVWADFSNLGTFPFIQFQTLCWSSNTIWYWPIVTIIF